MSRQWNDKQKDEASKRMLALWLKERMLKFSGCKQKTKLRIGVQRKIVFIENK
jgi:hypothetical protein